jgi:hypothetical protein
VFRIRNRIRINFGRLEGEKSHKKFEESEEISGFEVLDVPYKGLKASPVAWTPL